MIKGPKQLSYESMLRELGIFSPEETQGNFIDVSKYLVGVNERDRARFSSATEHEAMDTN